MDVFYWIITLIFWLGILPVVIFILLQTPEKWKERTLKSLNKQGISSEEFFNEISDSENYFRKMHQNNKVISFVLIAFLIAMPLSFKFFG